MDVSTVSYPATSSVKALLNSLFDYAGLFPPASLSLPDAFSEYLGHRAEADAWMTGPFVIPVSKLNDVQPLLENSEFHGIISFDVLPRVAPSLEKFALTLQEDLLVCKSFLEEQSSRADITSFEFRFPHHSFLDPAKGMKTVAQISDIFRMNGFEQAALYGEISRSNLFSQELPLYFLSLSSASDAPKILGKIRCGGMSNDDFPSPAELATFIHTAVQMNYPFKATAGLHHPIRHLNQAQNVKMHGFINFFFATTLARVHRLNPAEIQQILEEEAASSFIFTKAGIEWKSLTATNTDLIHDRKSLALSIGSCSFNEPRTDLTALGWLSKTPY